MTKNNAYWSWSFVHQKFSGAVDTLSTSFAPNWERMHFALLQLLVLLPDHFPDQDLYVRYEKLRLRTTRRGPYEINGRTFRGSLENTLRRSKRSTFERLAQEIVAIFDEVQRRRGHYVDTSRPSL